MIKDVPSENTADGSILIIGPSDRASSDERKEKTIARKLTRPEVQAAGIIQRFEKENQNVNALVTELTAQVKAVQGGDMSRPEAMLVAQAHTLDELFAFLARRAAGNIEGGSLDNGERYLRLAFKAQSQCRTTIESLAEIKNPRPVACVRQANFANGPQQINNGPSRAGETENQPNKLLEAQPNEWMDTGTTSTTSGVNPALETVGAVNRAEDGGR